MSLLKHAVSLTEEAAPTKALDVVKILNSALKGSEVTAFGKTGKGLWGTNDEEKVFAISKIVGHYFDDEDEIDGNYGTIDVHLVGYASKDCGLIYTDRTFIASFKQLLKEKGLMKHVKDVGYSEQGMQGKNFVNLDLTVKLKK